MVECWDCGREIKTPKAPKNTFTGEPLKGVFRQRCEACDEVYNKQRKEDLTNYLRLKSKLMFERAIRTLEAQGVDPVVIREAIEVVEERAIKEPEKFKSQHEMIVAIVLIHNRIHCKVNYKVGSHIADFLLPEKKCIIEVDGHLHGYDENAIKDYKRDVDIRAMLGGDWEIIRIGTKHIEQNAMKVPEAIDRMKAYIQSIRKENNGIIPDWFSKRHKNNWKKVVGEQLGASNGALF